MYRKRLVNRLTGTVKVLLQCCLLLLALMSAGFADDDEKPGLFEVRSAESRTLDGMVVIDARLQYILSSEALEALDNGIGLNFVIDIEVIESRRFWVDATVAEIRVPLQLQYHALSQRFLVRNLISGEQESFATLYSALNNLGRLTDYPLLEAASLKAEARYRGRIRSQLTFEDFSGAWRRIAFWLDEWHLKSDWFVWSLAS